MNGEIQLKYKIFIVKNVCHIWHKNLDLVLLLEKLCTIQILKQNYNA